MCLCEASALRLPYQISFSSCAGPLGTPSCFSIFPFTHFPIPYQGTLSKAYLAVLTLGYQANLPKAMCGIAKSPLPRDVNQSINHDDNLLIDHM